MINHKPQLKLNNQKRFTVNWSSWIATPKEWSLYQSASVISWRKRWNCLKCVALIFYLFFSIATLKSLLNSIQSLHLIQGPWSIFWENLRGYSLPIKGIQTMTTIFFAVTILKSIKTLKTITKKLRACVIIVLTTMIQFKCKIWLTRFTRNT